MVLQVLKPSPKKKGLSALDVILKGAQIAQSTFGIVSNIQKLKDAGAKSEALEVEQERETQLFPGKLEEQKAGIAKTVAETKKTKIQTGLIPEEFKLKQKKAAQDLNKSIKDIQQKENKSIDDLRKERFNNVVTKNTLDTITSIAKIREQPGTAAGDLALVFIFMKSLDPGSTVRESEFKAAASVRGIPDQVVQLREKILAGEILTKKQRIDFKNIAEKQLVAQLKVQKKFDQVFIRIAKKRGLPVEDIAPALVPDTEQADSGVVEQDGNLFKRNPETGQMDFVGPAR